MALYDGTVEDRYDREWLSLGDSRKVRGFDYQDSERQSREFVDPDSITVVDGAVSGSVTSTGDNNPDGFVKNTFEDSLVYNPNA